MKLLMTPFPTLLFYTDGATAAGDAKFARVRIAPAYKDDKGIHAHEYRHVTHWWLLTLTLWVSLAFWYYVDILPITATLIGCLFAPLVYGLGCTFVPRVRLWAELDCFRVQLKVNGQLDRAPKYATLIQERYDLKRYDYGYILRVLTSGF